MKTKPVILLNGLQDLRPLLKSAMVKAPTDAILKKFPNVSRTTIYRCVIGDGKHSKLFDIRKMAIKMINNNTKKISEETLTIQ